MTNNIYRHLRTNKLYELVLIARNVKTLEKEVVYKQLYSSKLRNTDMFLPKNSMWTRNSKEFEVKFKKV